MEKNYIVGIAGGSASGKTTIVNILKERFGDDITVICHDSYYRAHDELPFEEREKLNYDHPSSFETETLIEDLKKIRSGETIQVPVYDFSIHNRVRNKSREVEPAKVIVVDGFLVLQDKKLRSLMDLKLFVDTDADERLIRRIRRDMVERARTVDSVLNQYETTVKPMHEKYVEPSKKYADIIIPRGGENSIGIGLVKEYIKKLLR
jgi:uridine kinase